MSYSFNLVSPVVPCQGDLSNKLPQDVDDDDDADEDDDDDDDDVTCQGNLSNKLPQDVDDDGCHGFTKECLVSFSEGETIGSKKIIFSLSFFPIFSIIRTPTKWKAL